MVYKAAGYFILSGQPIASVVQHVIDKYGRQVRDRAAGNVPVHVAVIYDVYLMENTLLLYYYCLEFNRSFLYPTEVLEYCTV